MVSTVVSSVVSTVVNTVESKVESTAEGTMSTLVSTVARPSRLAVNRRSDLLVHCISTILVRLERCEVAKAAALPADEE